MFNQYSRFRSIVCWALAQWIDPDRWNDENRWDDFRRGLVQWLDPLHRKTSPGVESKRQDQHLKERPRRAYITFTSESRDRFIKQSCSADGDRVLRKECAVIKRLLNAAGTSEYKRYFPRWVDQYESAQRQVFVYQATTWRSFTAIQVRSRHPAGVSGRHVAWMFNRMLEAIGFAHRQGTVHAAVMPQHLLFDCGAHSLELTDWTHSKRIGQPITFLPKRYRKWYPQEMSLVAEPNLDIYMAAKSAMYLGGADSDGRVGDDALPRPIDRFLRSCLIESSRMRPNDAWRVHEEFQDILETVYGEPKFCSLEMD